LAQSISSFHYLKFQIGVGKVATSRPDQNIIEQKYVPYQSTSRKEGVPPYPQSHKLNSVNQLLGNYADSKEMAIFSTINSYIGPKIKVTQSYENEEIS